MTLDELQKLCDKATPGPWRIGHIDESLDRGEVENQDGIVIASDCKRNDEPFICAARQYMPLLIEAVRAAERFDQMRQVAQGNQLGHFRGPIIDELSIALAPFRGEE